MQPILTREWQKTLWKIVRNPAFEVVAAIVVVLFAAWIVVQNETDLRQPIFPVPFGSSKAR
jgi:ABC-type nickel/cobalt efflux system permease component RcnA